MHTRSVRPCAQVSLKRGSRFELLKSAFNTENFVCRLFWFISSNIGAIRSWSGSYSPKSKKLKSIKPLFCCSRSSKVIAFGTKRKRVYDFLLAINSRPNLGLISHRFWDTACWLKIANFSTPPFSFSSLVWNDSVRIFIKALRIPKLKSSTKLRWMFCDLACTVLIQ